MANQVTSVDTEFETVLLSPGEDRNSFKFSDTKIEG